MQVVYTRVRALFSALCVLASGVLTTNGASAGPDLGAYRVVSGQVRAEARSLVAGSDGAVLRYPGGLQLQLTPGTAVERFGAQPVWFASRGKTLAQLFEVRHGHLTASVTKGDGAQSIPAVFRTDRKLTGVCLDGEMAIDVGDQASVANLSGHSEVRKGTKWRELNVGQVLYTAGGLPEPQTRNLIAAPSWQSGRHLWSALQTQPEVGGFRWRAVPLAQTYEVSIVSSVSGERVHAGKVATTELPERSVRLPAGSYQVFVRGFDTAGFPGAWSGAHLLQVLGFVPRGESYLGSDGVARIGSDGTLLFSNTQGLEMTYDDAPGWIAASPVVYLRRDTRTLIGFRYPGDLDIVTVPAEAQSLSAEIRITPERAQWPGASVQIQVTLSDGAGGASAARVRPLIVTRVGLKHVTLNWTQEGNTWRAMLPAQSGKGPWVVRVSVLHPDGTELGRDLLEVASPKAKALRRRVPTQWVSAPPPELLSLKGR